MVAITPPGSPEDKTGGELPDIIFEIAKEIRDLEESGAPTESILTFLTAHRATYLSPDTLVPLARGFLFEMYRRFTNAEDAEEEFNSDNIVENLRKIADAIESGGELSLL